METFIMIVTLCHFNLSGQEGCIPMTPEPQIYYNSKQECIKATEQKMDEMATIAIYNNIIITKLYANCIEEKTKPKI
jgi:hypothetical protein